MVHNTRNSLAILLGLILLFVLAAYAQAGHIAPASDAPDLSTTVDVLQLDAETPIEEDYENQKIEQALCEEGYYRNDIPLSYDLQDVMQSACRCYDVPYSLALAVCQTESSFDPNVQNGICNGYMQLQPENYQRLREKTECDPESPDGNIVCGVCYLGEKIHAYQSEELGLMAYNQGDAGAAEDWAKGVYGSDYSHLVLARAASWQKTLDGKT